MPGFLQEKSVGMPVLIGYIMHVFMLFPPFLSPRLGLSSSKHSGIRGLFNKQYVKTGQIPKDIARIYNDLFERRQEGDYMDFVNFQESQVLPWISKAEKLIKHIAEFIKNQKI